MRRILVSLVLVALAVLGTACNPMQPYHDSVQSDVRAGVRTALANDPRLGRMETNQVDMKAKLDRSNANHFETHKRLANNGAGIDLVNGKLDTIRDCMGPCRGKGAAPAPTQPKAIPPVATPVVQPPSTDSFHCGVDVTGSAAANAASNSWRISCDRDGTPVVPATPAGPQPPTPPGIGIRPRATAEPPPTEMPSNAATATEAAARNHAYTAVLRMPCMPTELRATTPPTEPEKKRHCGLFHRCRG